MPLPGCSMRSASSPSSLVTSCRPVGSLSPSEKPSALRRFGMQLQLIASGDTRIAELVEMPGLGNLLALMVVDVLVVAVDEGHASR